VVARHKRVEAVLAAIHSDVSRHVRRHAADRHFHRVRCSSNDHFSVRWAAPLIYVVVAASALQVLFPGPLSMWLLRNRKYLGLSFAVAMAWQGLFIFIVSYFQREYYYEEIFLIRDELERSTGYLFLAAMVVTSFQAGRRYLNAKQWRLLHKSGIYFLWACPFSTYWWNLYY